LVGAVALSAAIVFCPSKAQILGYNLGVAAESVIQIREFVPMGVGYCSAFYLGDGFVGTANHCILDPTGIFQAKLHDKIVELEYVDANPAFDVALLRFKNIEDADLPAIKIRSSVVQLGEHIYYMGFPNGSNTVGLTTEEASVIFPVGGSDEIIWTTDSAYPGMSGGPVVDENGNVVGLVRGIQMLPIIEMPATLFHPDNHHHHAYTKASPVSPLAQLLEAHKPTIWQQLRKAAASFISPIYG
jgi:S1-C subfamily serine protease